MRRFARLSEDQLVKVINDSQVKAKVIGLQDQKSEPKISDYKTKDGPKINRQTEKEETTQVSPLVFM